MDRMRGFTLIELITTMAVAAVLLAIVVPSFQSISRNNAVRTATNDLMSTINIARMQAVSTRTNLVLKPANGGWSSGWALELSAAGVEEDLETIPNGRVSVSRTVGNGSLVFLARGGLQGGAAEFKVSHNDDANVSRTFCVSFFGKITPGECS